MSPEIKIMACSNVYIRLMNFLKAGDFEVGHSHTYDHATVLSSGEVKYEILDGYDGRCVAEKMFTAPEIIYVEKNKFHRITALKDNTVCSCTHALRTIDEDLIPQDCLIDTVYGQGLGEVQKVVEHKTGKPWKPIINTLDQMNFSSNK